MYKFQDKFAVRAKEEGFRARSAYKLLDIQQKYHVMKEGDAVLDLGAAPGSWLQVARKIVGPKGTLIGIDSEPIKHIDGVIVIQKDVLDRDLEELVLRKFGKKFDVALSDAAPFTSGMKERDQMLSHELSSRAFEIAQNALKKRGNAVIKVLEGSDTPQLLREVKTRFSKVAIIKPMASQKGSKERYIVALGFQV